MDENDSAGALAAFRAEWTSELNSIASTSIHPASSLPGNAAAPLSSSSRAADQEKTALEYYATAVLAEAEGDMNEALFNYRKSFRMDPDVDKAFHAASLLSSAPPLAPVDYDYERTAHLADSRKERETDGNYGHHPSSTKHLKDSLLASIAANPWIRSTAVAVGIEEETRGGSDELEKAIDGVSSKAAAAVDEPCKDTVVASRKVVTAEEAYDQLDFMAADDSLPLLLSTLPHEVLILILRSLSLTPSYVPPSKAAKAAAALEAATAMDPAAPPVAVAKPRGKKPRTIKEEMKFLESELELESSGRAWITDISSLERFASACRMSRILTLETSIWRDICLRTFVAPHQIAHNESAESMAKQKYGNDWRRFLIEQPRIRLDGCFIAVVTYLRRGESNTYSTPTHLVTFYRYLRFYPNGLVVSLLTTDSPEAVVRKLNPTLRVSGILRGRWRLRGDVVDCWGLEDPNVAVRDQRRYSFRMSLQLKSTARGRMNKLDLTSLATENRRTLELENVSIQPTKPFFFSKVGSYCISEDEEIATAAHKE